MYHVSIREPVLRFHYPVARIQILAGGRCRMGHRIFMAKNIIKNTQCVMIHCFLWQRLPASAPPWKRSNGAKTENRDHKMMRQLKLLQSINVLTGRSFCNQITVQYGLFNNYVAFCMRRSYFSPFLSSVSHFVRCLTTPSNCHSCAIPILPTSSMMADAVDVITGDAHSICCRPTTKVRQLKRNTINISVSYQGNHGKHRILHQVHMFIIIGLTVISESRIFTVKQAQSLSSHCYASSVSLMMEVSLCAAATLAGLNRCRPIVYRHHKCGDDL